MVNDMAAEPIDPPGPATQLLASEPAPQMITPRAARAVVVAMTQLANGVAHDRAAALNNSPTVEEILREKLRRVIKEWLDTHLPPMVEHRVRIELERLSASVPIID
jgi:uncharacterized protein